MLSLQLIMAVTTGNQSNCNLLRPPVDAGETQVHSVTIYIYPRSHTIDETYSGCQNQWFLDDDHFRKLSVIHYNNGAITAYDNINLRGEVGYHCQYGNEHLSDHTAGQNDSRCPAPAQLQKKTYQSGCYSQSTLNSADSYEVAMPSCELK